MACDNLVSHTTKDWTGELCALALGDFSKDKHFVNISIKRCITLTVYKSCFIPVVCLDVSEYLPLFDPLWGVVFQEQYWARY